MRIPRYLISKLERLFIKVLDATLFNKSSSRRQSYFSVSSESTYRCISMPLLYANLKIGTRFYGDLWEEKQTWLKLYFDRQQQ